MSKWEFEKKRKFKNKFWVVYLIFLLAALGAIAYGLNYLWGMMEEYEVSTTKYALADVSDLFQAENFTELTATMDLNKISFEGNEQVISVYENQLLNGDITYTRLVKASGENIQDYSVKAGNTQVGELTIEFDDSGMFGKWNITNTKLLIPIWGDVVVRMPANSTLFINGKEVGEEYITKSEIKYEELQLVPEGYEVTTQVEYTVSGFYVEPKVSAVDFYGNQIEVSLEEEPSWKLETQANPEITTLYATISPPSPQGDVAELFEMAVSDAKNYSHFLTNYVSFSAIGERMLKESEIYEYIRTVVNKWYSSYISVEFTDEKASNYTQFTHDVFTVDLDYMYTVYRSYDREHPFETKIKLVYAMEDGVWKIADIRIR